MTERLYYHDPYLTEFDARVVDSAEAGRRVYLDRTAFYPTSGGQQFDLGTLGGIPVKDVIDENDRVAHVLASPLSALDVHGEIDWRRRYDHMQQHTGQHLLSAVLEELFGYATVSFHMGAEVSTIDIQAPGLTPEQIERAQDRCLELTAVARPVSISFEDASGDLGLRKASERQGTLRIISIQDYDRSACGGTHVRTTAEVAPIFIRKLDKVRDTARVEFVCGERALARAHRDYRLLADIGRQLASPIEKTPDLISGLVERNKALEKSAGRLSVELAKREGNDLYHTTAPSADGVRYHRAQGPIDDSTRSRAQGFTANPRAVFLAISADPPSVLLASSADSGIHAGERMKAAVAAAKGRGGGAATLAQGSAPDLDALLAALAL